MGSLASLPKPQQPLTIEGQHIERTWYMALIQLITNVAGAVIGPSSSTDNAIVRWDGTTGQLLQNSVVPLADDGTFSFPDGIRQTFNPNATNSGFNVGAQAGNPVSLVDGDIWYNSSVNKLFARINGVTVQLSGSTGADYVVMSDGANPPSPLDDGAGNFIYVGYTP